MKQLLEQLIDASLSSKNDWGVDYIPRRKLAFVRDVREDADAAIIAAVGASVGLQVVCEGQKHLADGRTVLAALFKADKDATDKLRTAYYSAMQSDATGTDVPF